MLKIRILALGKLKEAWLREGCADYLRRIRLLARADILEFADEPAPDGMGTAQLDNLLCKEGEKVLKAISPSTHVVLLDLAGAVMDSPGLAAHLKDCSRGGSSQLDFVIGGSYGVSPQLRQRANLRLSFSAFTFPHQLMRLILLEQLYRSLKINAGHPYHK